MSKHAADTVPAFSPPEIIKRANARDHRLAHVLDLHRFLTWLRTGPGLLRELPPEKIDTLISDYLDAVEPQVQP